MAKRIFITATNTDIGKTFTTRLLIDALSDMGLSVGVFKPIETGVSNLPADGALLYDAALRRNPKLSALSLDDIVPVRFALPAAPFVAGGGAPIDWHAIDRALSRIEEICDIVLIEGAGGVMVPVDDTRMMIDLPRYFNAVTLLVTHCRLGCINDTLLSIHALESAKVPYVWSLNCRETDEEFTRISLPYFTARFETLYFVQDDIHAIARSLLDTIASLKEE